MVWKYKQRVRYSLEHRLLSNDTKRHHFNLTLRLPEAGRGLEDGVKDHGWNEKIGKMEPHQIPSPLALYPRLCCWFQRAKTGSEVG